MREKVQYIFYGFVTLLLGTTTLGAMSYETAPTTSQFLKGPESSVRLIVNNQPLVKIHGKTISVLDVQKKMDLFLKEHHPDEANSELLCYQFYTQMWRQTLQDIIDSELISMEAEELKVKISDSEVNQELETRFGPNVIERIDELGISFDEAKAIVKDSMISRNMSWYRIWARTNQLVSPEAVKAGYSEFIATLDKKDEWAYQTLTIRGTIDEDTYGVSEQINSFLVDHPNSNFSDVITILEENLPKTVTLNVSSLLEQTEQDLSPEYVSILKRLPLNSFSPPIQQVSRTDGSKVYRVFQLKKYQETLPPSFEEKFQDIQNDLFQHFGELQKSEYMTKLKKHFCCEDLDINKMYHSDFQPFVVIQ